MLERVKKRLITFLRYTQRFTGTDNVYIVREGFWSALGFLSGTFFSFLTVLAFANLLPVDTYGSYKYIQSIGGIASFLFLNGINTAVARTVARGHEGALPYAVQLQLWWNLIYVTAAMCVAVYYYLHGNMVFAVSMAILAIVNPLVSAFNTYGAYLTARTQFRLQSVYGAISGIWYGIFMVGAVLLTHDIRLLVAAYAVGTLTPLVIFYTITLRSLHNSELSIEERDSLINFTKHLSIVNIISTVAQYIDKVAMFQFVGPAALATYSFATIGPDNVKGYLKSANSIIFPKVASRTVAELDKVFYTRVLQCLGLGVLASVGYSLIAHPVFALFFPKYLDAVPYSQVLSISLLSVMPSVYMGHATTSHKMLRIIYLGGSVPHGLKIVLFVLFGYLYGAWGIIAAAVTAQLLNVAWNCFLWYWFVRRPQGAYHPGRPALESAQ